MASAVILPASLSLGLDPVPEKSLFICSAAHLIGRRAVGPDGGFCHVAWRPLHVIGKRLNTCSKCGPNDLQRRQVQTNPDRSGCIISDSADDRPEAGLDAGLSTFKRVGVLRVYLFLVAGHYHRLRGRAHCLAHDSTR